MTLQNQVFRIDSKGIQCVRTLLVKVEVTVVSKNTICDDDNASKSLDVEY